ncbi:hypothetical protein DXG01_007766 [Tephrocybe rancida]|nr:hypothetical protein DXG01_007766 [Tephrocybe rancida]
MAHVYTFKNAGYDGTLVLDLSGADHTTVLGWTPNGGPNQKWTLERDILLFAFFFKNLDNRYLGIDSTLQRPVGVEDQAQAVKFHIEPAQQGKVR